MQDPTTFQQIKPHFPEQEHLKCPRCDSTNTKFCYYNNYNLSQPRHFCKNCRRYWTKGGALRNIPVGGGSRKNTKRPSNPKRSSSSSSSSSSTSSLSSSSSVQNAGLKTEPAGIYSQGLPLGIDPDRRMLDMTGSFSSLLSSNGQFGNLLDGFNSSDPGIRTIQFGEFTTEHSNSSSLENLGLDLHNGNNQDSLLSIQGNDSSNCWAGGNGWPDLAIHTPGSSFQ